MPQIMSSDLFLVYWYQTFLNLLFTLGFFAIFIAGFANIMARLIRFIHDEKQQYEPNKYLVFMKEFLSGIRKPLFTIMPLLTSMWMPNKQSNISAADVEKIVKEEIRKAKEHESKKNDMAPCVIAPCVDYPIKEFTFTSGTSNNIIGCNDVGEHVQAQCDIAIPTNTKEIDTTPKDELKILVKNAVNLSELSDEEKHTITNIIVKSIQNIENITDFEKSDFDCIIDRLNFNIWSIIKTEANKHPSCVEWIKNKSLHYTNWPTILEDLPEVYASIMHKIPIDAMREFLEKYTVSTRHAGNFTSPK